MSTARRSRRCRLRTPRSPRSTRRSRARATRRSPALKADATKLFVDYRVYWLRVPQTQGHRGRRSPRRGAVPARRTPRRSSRPLVGSNAAAQADLAAMNQALATADAKLGTPPAPGPNLAPVPGLQPAADMTHDTAVLQAAHNDLLAARAALVEAGPTEPRSSPTCSRVPLSRQRPRPLSATLRARNRLELIKNARSVAEITLGMRGSGVNWPAEGVPDTSLRTGGSRMLLDELLAERERAHDPADTAAGADGRPGRGTADRSTRVAGPCASGWPSSRARPSATTARRKRRAACSPTSTSGSQEELAARTHAAARGRGTAPRGRSADHRRGEAQRRRSAPAPSARPGPQIADELKRFQEEHERVVHEMTVLRSSLSEHDGLLDEYVHAAARRARRARDAAGRARSGRSGAFAGRTQLAARATENARHGAEDEMIRLATAEQQLADAASDRDRFAAQLAELTSGDGAIGRMTAQLEARDAEIATPRGPHRRSERAASTHRRTRRATRWPSATTRSRRRPRPKRGCRMRSRPGPRPSVAVAAATTRIAELEADHGGTRRSERRARPRARQDSGEAAARGARCLERPAHGRRGVGDSRGRARRVARSGRRSRGRKRAGACRWRPPARARRDARRRARGRARDGGRAAGGRVRTPRPRGSDRGARAAQRRPLRRPHRLAPQKSCRRPSRPRDRSFRSRRRGRRSRPTDVPPPLPLRIAGRHTPAPPLARRRPAA